MNEDMMFMYPAPHNPIILDPAIQQRRPDRNRYVCRELSREVRPVVRYGIDEARKYNCRHAINEVARIAYLMGRGYDFTRARRIVENCQANERFDDLY